MTEEVTLTSGAPTAVNSTSFKLPYNKDFAVWANVSAGNLTSTVAVNVKGSFDDSNFSTIKSNLVTDCDAANSYAFFDALSDGMAPYYKLELAPLADEQGALVKVAVVIGV